jgi:hypothetical protein
VIYRVAADLVVLLHAAFVLFVLFGGVLAWWRRGWIWLHLPAMTWGILIELCGWVCPLTYLENFLRRQAGQSGYTGGFVEHYLIPVLYPERLDRSLQLALALVVVVVNALIYGVTVVRAWKLRRSFRAER